MPLYTPIIVRVIELFKDFCGNFLSSHGFPRTLKRQRVLKFTMSIALTSHVIMHIHYM